jgi:hypothetical protein
MAMLQFKRITTEKRFIPQIDGLRFVAIASDADAVRATNVTILAEAPSRIAGWRCPT